MVKQILYGHKVDMGGIPIRQPLPTQQIEQIDPFLLLHHHIGHLKPDSDYKSIGVGPHPHRGFSPVTFIYQGDVHHRDSRQNSSIVSAGGVQWMNAGMGIVHSERPSKTLSQKGGVQEIIQLWINTPASKKMNQPEYQAFQATDMPKLTPKASLVSGTEGAHKGPAKTEVPIKAVMAELAKGDTLRLSVDYKNSFVYLLRGQLKFKKYGLIDDLNLVWLEEDLGSIEIEASGDSKFLFMSADPLNEPLATHGPFVMNNQTQIMEAMRDYQMGKMGILIEAFD